MAGRLQGGVARVVDWPTLPEDVIRKIGDLVLSTDNDDDYYADFRGACGGWRRATQPKFMPTKWINLEHSDYEDMPYEAKFTFMNLNTGRCVQKDFKKLISRWAHIHFVSYTVLLKLTPLLYIKGTSSSAPPRTD